MKRYAGVAVLCGLLGLPALLAARVPAPQPRPDKEPAEASEAVAERLLVKQYGADAKGVKSAKLKFSFQVTQPDARSENGHRRDLFAIAAEDVSYSDDGLVTFKNARYVRHHYCPTEFQGEKYTGWTEGNSDFATLRFQFAGPVRRLQDIHKSRLKSFKVGKKTDVFNNAEVKPIEKKITD